MNMQREKGQNNMDVSASPIHLPNNYSSDYIALLILQ